MKRTSILKQTPITTSGNASGDPLAASAVSSNGLLDAARDAVEALEFAHSWLEDVKGYISLDHKIGGNIEGCCICAAHHKLQKQIKASNTKIEPRG